MAVMGSGKHGKRTAVSSGESQPEIQRNLDPTANQRRRRRHHSTQTGPELTAEHIFACAPRNPRLYLSLKRHPSGLLWRISERLVQLRPHLSPLVQSRLQYSGTLGFLGRLVRTMTETSAPVFWKHHDGLRTGQHNGAGGG